MDDNLHTATILKELSDIKASLAVNTNETANIKASMTEIKVDIKEIKSDFVNRREFGEKIKDIQDSLIEMTKYDNRLKWLERVAYGGIGILAAIQFYFNVIQ